MKFDTPTPHGEKNRIPPGTLEREGDAMNTSGLLNESEAAETLNMQGQTLSKWRQRDFGPPYHRQGGRILYKLEGLKLWQDSCRIVPAETSPRRIKPRRPHRKKQQPE
jgi:hypothetical protein